MPFTLHGMSQRRAEEKGEKYLTSTTSWGGGRKGYHDFFLSGFQQGFTPCRSCPGSNTLNFGPADSELCMEDTWLEINSQHDLK